ncbi:MAG: UvrD-helicase domain-containing protein [Spirochaetes bacterium]|nr:UvrD-helicase domain-containing protein [Spirochaetota bacterium]
MTFAADLHLHSRWSRATSREAGLEGYHAWALLKGISLLGTGDFTHPRWLADIGTKLVERDGLLALKDPPREPALEGARPADIPVRFMLTTEISSIYRKDGATRKVHSLVGVPTVEDARRLAARLAGIGNVASDGRPILGLDPKDLLAILLDISADAFLIPAHIWTPWFSLFGSRSGFDRIEDCFEDLTPHVFALETGLSSDPPMNRRWSSLDRFRLVSNSDAHSPANLGREANLFDTGLDYRGVLDGLRTGAGFRGTVEFFPEEGKYHFDGHRACSVCQDPEETRRRGDACPVCGKKLTVGVLNRVLALADRPEPVYPRPQETFRRLVPLPELLGEAVGTGSGSKAVAALYARLVSTFGSEYAFLLETPLEDIARGAGTLLAEAVKRMREGAVETSPGYDGEFGVVRVFAPGERERLAGQDDLFAGLSAAPRKRRDRAPAEADAAGRDRPACLPRAEAADDAGSLDADQSAAVASDAGSLLVFAGPGSGKTRVLTHWIARRVRAGAATDGRALAVTFTNRAAVEVRQRLRRLLGEAADRVTVSTFHALCHSLLRERDPGTSTVYGPRDREELLRLMLPPDQAGRAPALAARIERCLEGTDRPDADLAALIGRYRDRLSRMGALDLSALVADAVGLLRADGAFLASIRKRFPVIAVDELQDINPAQFDLLRLLSAGSPVLCIGDPDQAIYGFRGSDRSLFYRFRDEAEARTYTLPLNYRSTPAIVRAAAGIIGEQRAVPVPPAAVRPGRDRVRVFAADDPAAEAGFIASAIDRLVGGVDSVAVDALRGTGGGRSFADFAVLFRTRAVRDALLPGFERAGLPFTLREDAPVTAGDPWRTVAAALRFLGNPADRVALAEILGRPARALDRAMRAALASGDGVPDVHSLPIGSDAEPGLGRAAAFAARLAADRDALLARIAADGLEPVLVELMDELLPGEDPGLRTGPAAEMLRETARETAGDLERFLRRLDLSPLESESGLKTEKVQLLTFHAAKGLEFPVVFIAGAEEGITPLGEDLGEERRLFYVAVTRAMDELYISYCAHRMVYGKKVDTTPSRYLSDIPDTCRESIAAAPDRARRTRDAKQAGSQLPLF